MSKNSSVWICAKSSGIFVLVSGAAVSMSAFKMLNKEVQAGSLIFQHGCEFLCYADLTWDGLGQSDGDSLGVSGSTC